MIAFNNQVSFFDRNLRSNFSCSFPIFLKHCISTRLHFVLALQTPLSYLIPLLFQLFIQETTPRLLRLLQLTSHQARCQRSLTQESLLGLSRMEQRTILVLIVNYDGLSQIFTVILLSNCLFRAEKTLFLVFFFLLVDQHSF